MFETLMNNISSRRKEFLGAAQDKQTDPGRSPAISDPIHNNVTPYNGTLQDDEGVHHLENRNWLF